MTAFYLIVLFLASFLIADTAPLWLYVLWLAGVILYCIHLLKKDPKFDNMNDAIRHCRCNDLTAYIVIVGNHYCITDKPPEEGNCVFVTKGEAYLMDYMNKTGYHI